MRSIIDMKSIIQNKFWAIKRREKHSSLNWYDWTRCQAHAVNGGYQFGELGRSIIQSTGAVEYSDCISAEELYSHNECPVYDTKQSDGEVLVMPELWRMWSTPSFSSLSDSPWPGVVAAKRVLSIG